MRRGILFLLLIGSLSSSSCHLTFGGRGTLNCVVDRALDGAVVQVSHPPPPGE